MSGDRAAANGPDGPSSGRARGRTFGGMTAIRDLIDAGSTLSFEFFPPKTADAEVRLRDTIDALEKLCLLYTSPSPRDL